MANGTLAASQIEMLSQSGTGIITITPPATNTNRAITLPDAAGEVVLNSATQTLTNKDIVATQLTGDVAAARITTALNASGSAPIFAARAWVNFNGTGTVAIRASGNVSSITDNGVGDYTVNFTTAMPDANYVATFGTTRSDSAARRGGFLNLQLNQNSGGTVPTSSSIRLNNAEAASDVSAAGAVDTPFAYVSVFR